MRPTHILAVVALVLAACSPTTSGTTTGDSSAPADTTTRPPATVGIGGGATPFLVGFDSCSSLLDHLRTEAAERVGPYGLDGMGGPWMWMTEETAAADGAARAGDDSAAGGDGGSVGGHAGTSFTGTNTQEAGVDEPDVVKTDGERILALSENVLAYVDLSGDEPVVSDRLPVPEGWGHELFFEGDRAFLFTNDGGWHDGPIRPLDEPASDAIRPAGSFMPAVVVTEVDLSDPTRLAIVRTLRAEGQYLSARSVDGTIRMVMTSPPSQLPWVYPSGPAGEERAEETNRELVMETTIEDWIPEYEVEDAAGETSGGPLVDCAAVSRPAEFSGFDFVSVLTFDLGGGLTPGDGVAVLAGGQQVYASLDRLYVATSKWAGEEVTDDASLRRWSESYTTSVHAFDITAETPVYVASAELDGSLLDQFSMDEHDGHLRVVTTEGSPWDERDVSETFLTVLAEDGDRLVQVGRVGGLGKGESLYSARLLDDVGFAVTFRQIDPFYVLDLTDPAAPVVAGELKLPGFSTYLHPVGEDLVLGIGQDATEEGMVTGFKVSLFSVADRSAPVELDSWTMDDAGSPAEHDHRAFQFLPDQGLAIVPIVQWTGGFNGAVLLEVSPSGLTERGTVTQVEPTSEPATDCRMLDPGGEDSELARMMGGGVVLVCEDGQIGGYGGHSCEPIPIDDLASWLGSSQAAEELVAEADVPEGGRVEICWPDDQHWRQQIQRSLVIGDSLWTMSAAHLQADDLTTLERVARLDLR